MFFTITHDQVQFHYGSKRWQYSFNEIVELGLLKKKKSYLIENGLFITITAIAYYCMVFSDVMELYYIVPTLLCYTFIIIYRFHGNIDSEYYVIVKDVYQNEIRIKIKTLDRPAIGKQIDRYLDLEFDRNLQLQNSNT
ncbi:hypothetical protein [Flavobacterium sp. HTF]|uniref:hypothetical protein n=1 Tax=Flavobacterium sp. HTF TaxID=2170732 RepID=UPI000D5F9DBD|nr:hypothetical protein [Flavobacterium sp. HTF]PWB27982.1 hypothetical protein DCO46_01805 [Flavobacterium sp. HTF]